MTVKTVAAFALIAMMTTANAAYAEEGFASGDTITAQTAVDVAEIKRVADAIDAAVDAKDWPAARSLFADTISVDFTSLIGGEPATIPADALINGWSTNLTAEKTSFHMRSNHRVTFDGPDAATMASHGYAWNRMEAGAAPENGGNPLWEVWGSYEHGFVRTPQGWKVNRMSLTVAAQRGNTYVRDTVPAN
ncbi:MAG: nuclear transport factor 2 family protein [Pseudomonadota bacterium]